MDNTDVASNYFATIAELSPTSEVIIKRDIAPEQVVLDTIWLFAPLAIFFIVFIIGIITLIKSNTATIARGFFIFIVAIGLGALPVTLKGFLIPTQLESQADVEKAPRDIIINDVSSTGFKISWKTNKAGIGAIRTYTTLGDTKKSQVLSESGEAYKTSHEIVVSNKTPDTIYYIEILSYGTWYDNDGIPLEVKTTSN